MPRRRKGTEPAERLIVGEGLGGSRCCKSSTTRYHKPKRVSNRDLAKHVIAQAIRHVFGAKTDLMITDLVVGPLGLHTRRRLHLRQLVVT